MLDLTSLSASGSAAVALVLPPAASESEGTVQRTGEWARLRCVYLMRLIVAAFSDPVEL